MWPPAAHPEPGLVSRLVMRVSVRSHQCKTRAGKTRLRSLVCLCINPVQFGKPKSYATSILQGKLLRGML